ncbi:MAG: RHS repeat domain-containing protein, partial [Bacteroidota bacterium]
MPVIRFASYEKLLNLPRKFVSIYNAQRFMWLVFDECFSVCIERLAIRVKDAKNNPTTYAYDGHDRLKTTTFPDNSDEILSYHAGGRLTQKIRRDGA